MYHNYPKHVTEVLFSYSFVKLKYNFRKFSYISVKILLQFRNFMINFIKITLQFGSFEIHLMKIQLSLIILRKVEKNNTLPL